MSGRNGGRLDRVQQIVAPDVCPVCRARAVKPISATEAHALVAHALVETLAGRMDRRTGAAVASLGRAVFQSLVIADLSEQMDEIQREIAALSLELGEESDGPERT